MALERALGGDGKLFVGEDKIVEIGPVVDLAGVPIDMTGWAVMLIVRLSDDAPTIALSKAGNVLGTYSATAALNTQYLKFLLTAAETRRLVATTYRYSVKRMDTGAETIVSFGPFIVQKTTQH